MKPLEARFLEVGSQFQDAKGTHKEPALKYYPPTLAFAPNQRIPSAKQRQDGRQGTIDQDPEFIAFLEAETMPVTRPAGIDTGEKTATVKVTSTPLIDDLREKKANKSKAAAAKPAKGHARNGSKDEKAAEKAPAKTEHAAKEAVKALNKQAAQVKAQPAAAQAKAASPARSKKPAGPAQKPVPTAAADATPKAAIVPASPNKRRERGNAEGIKKMLQKDLGLAQKPAQARNTSAKAAAAATAAQSAATAPAPAQQATPAARRAETSSTTTTSPAIAPPPAARPARPPKAITPLPDATKAYLKHANPSQGMTNENILAALATHGELSSVTIDPRKGTAIAVFKDTEGLKKAMEARRVPVAEGAVEVNEYRERPAGNLNSARGSGRGGFRGGRGGRGGAAGAGGAASPSPAPTPAAATPPSNP